MSDRRDGAIAIVGMACRYADARTPAELWENALAGRRAFRRMPPERLRLADYLRPGDPDGLYATEAAVLEGWEFDRVRFKVAGPAFRAADLAHWLALEVAAEALADAGCPDARGLPRDTSGVLVGNTLTGEFSRANLMRLRWPYVRRTLAAALGKEGEGWDEARVEAFLARLEPAYKAPFPETSEESLAGGLSNTIAGRISNHFDLHGGGYTVDGACASSLLAVANACSALAAGDLDFALAGGVDLSLDPFELAGFARNGALAHGEMRVYDARADGFIPGEGCGFVALMRAADARAAGRRVLAVVRGWGISSDGGGGISRPEAAGQMLAIRRAYRRAGFGIETAGYFEGHGTGTAVGDATELAALARARREAGAAGRAPVGSIKASIGHTKAAAGVAGVIRTVLAMTARVVPPMPAAGGDEPHPALAAGGALYVPRFAEPWPAGRPLRAGVSAMGFGGINVHLAIEGEGEGTAAKRGLSARERSLARSAQDAEILAFAAESEGDLAREVARAAELAPRLSRAELGDFAAALFQRLRGAGGNARAAVVAANPAEAGERLAELVEWLGKEREEKALGRAKEEAALLPPGVFVRREVEKPLRVGFLFPGQGSPVHADGGAWRRRFEAVEDLFGDAAAEDPIDTAVAQPAIIAASIAGLRVLQSLGIAAEVGVGHSLGEIAALCWAGAIEERSAVGLAAARGRAMAATVGERGAMASLGAEPSAVEELLGESGGESVVIAAYNGPRRTVVSGSATAVEAAAERAARRGWAVHRLRVSHAFHSPLVAGAAARLEGALAEVAWAPLARTVISTVSGARVADDPAALLRRQLTSPVRFVEALAAAQPLADLWIEVGPGAVLGELAGEILGRPVVSIDAGGPSLAGLLSAAAACFAAGLPVRLEALFAGRFTRPFDLERPLVFLANPCESAPIGLQLGGTPVIAQRAEPKPPVDRAPGLSPLELVRALVAARAELPPAAVAGDSRLLADLHLNSIAVGQLVVEASRRLGLPPSASPTDFAPATVAEVAEALAARVAAGERADLAESEADGRPPRGIAPWVRAFTVEHRLRPLAVRRAPRAGGAFGNWQVIAPPGHALAAALRDALTLGIPLGIPEGGVALCLPADPAADTTAAVDLFLAAARAVLAAPRPGRFLLVQHGERAGGGFARTLHLELPAVATAVVELPASMDPRRAAELAAAEAASVRGYAEACYDGDGRRSEPVLAPLDLSLDETVASPLVALGAGDVLLVSGGGKGIGAECALALARGSGARLAILGRSDPATDGELAANLERLAAAGVPALYVRADVADPVAVRAAVERVTAALGPVTTLVHAAGRNRPCRLADLDREAFIATLAPKVEGARNLFAALDPAKLSLAVGFGSIIARTGLPGEADYAVANDWLGAVFAQHSAAHPACRCLVVDWSVWAGTGMGERLGTLAALARAGVEAIPLDAGVRALSALLARPPAAPAVVVSGRFGAPPTLALAARSDLLSTRDAELPLRRFLEWPRVFYPGIELVAEARISADTDPYLADHVFRGEPLFAAVLGLEAMAQAAMALRGADLPPVFEQVELRRPVAVAPGAATTLRIAALARPDGAVEVAVRDAASGFAIDCFRAVCRFDLPSLPIFEIESASPHPADAVALAIDPAADLYGGILFHRGRFRRLREYRRLSATACLAEISPDGASRWFGAYLPADLVLGDPGARDAAIHGIQACIPHAHLLPVGVERIAACRLPAEAPLVVSARERPREGPRESPEAADFVYDLEIRDAGGRLRERWEGLRLRAVDRTPVPAAWPAPLLAPYLERRLAELLPGAGVAVVLEPAALGALANPTPAGRSDSRPALARLLGSGAVLRHRADGRPEVEGGPRISIAHAGGLVLAVACRAAVGCDLEPVVARPAEDWRGLLGDELWALARLIRSEGSEETKSSETADAAATRVWAAAEALVKAGAPAGAPLTLEAATDDGWLILRSGRYRVATAVPAVRGLGRAAVAMAVVIEEDERPKAIPAMPVAATPWAARDALPALARGGNA